MSLQLAEYCEATERDKKWTACLNLMHEVRTLIVQAKHPSSQIKDASEALIEFDTLYNLSRDAQGANVSLGRDKNSSKFVIIKQYLHNVNSWELPDGVIRQMQCSVRFLETQVDARDSRVYHNHKSWTLKNCVQKILDLQISEHMTFIVFKYYPIMLNVVFQDKLHHDPNFIIETANDLVLATTTMHSAGVTHRDIKLENISFNKRSRVVLIDFDSGAQTLRTPLRRTLPVCTLFTRPPEHFMDSLKEGKSDTYDPIAGDWWSVGCVIAQLFLSGQYLFPVRRDWHESEYLEEMRKFCAEFKACYTNQNQSSEYVRVKTLMRAQMPQDLRAFLVGVLSFDSEHRKVAAQSYITTLLSSS